MWGPLLFLLLAIGAIVYSVGLTPSMARATKESLDSAAIKELSNSAAIKPTRWRRHYRLAHQQKQPQKFTNFWGHFIFLSHNF